MTNVEQRQTRVEQRLTTVEQGIAALYERVNKNSEDSTEIKEKQEVIVEHLHNIVIIQKRQQNTINLLARQLEELTLPFNTNLSSCFFHKYYRI